MQPVRCSLLRMGGLTHVTCPSGCPAMSPGLSFPFSLLPLFFANGLTRRLPVTFPPLLVAGLEEGLNLSNLKSRRGGRHAALVLCVAPPGLHSSHGSGLKC